MMVVIFLMLFEKRTGKVDWKTIGQFSFLLLLVS